MEDDVTVIEDGMPCEIIQFPKKHLRPEILDAELAARNQKAKEYYVRDVMDKFLDQAHEALISFGIVTNTPEFEKDFFFFQNALSAMFCRSFDVEHPLHPLINAAERQITEDGEVAWTWPNLTVAPPERRPRAKKSTMAGNTTASVVADDPFAQNTAASADGTGES